jgi:butyryl-CoA dehydrogenase
MASYKTPLRDMRFVLAELFDGEQFRALPGYGDVTPDLVDSVLEEAGRVCEELLFPLNRSGDEEGARLVNGEVQTPKGFREAYRTYAESGWTALAADPAWGGQGLPSAVGVLVQEMVCATNLAFGMFSGLSHGAYTALASHATDAIKARYLPKLVSGKWTGTMCLTEPQCGTDLGLVRTRAIPQPDGSHRITGAKLFISAGDHDLTDNILHLVLARLPDAPPGIKGISLFLVPKVLVRDDGSLGERNGVTCTAIEQKMGIHASPTCALAFENAVGYLIGEPNKGMRAMFTMMNEERVAVGVQGLGLAEASYQGAVAYARERLQGRSVAGPKHPDKPADPILVHPDVRRMLLTMRAYVEGGRALAMWVALGLDEARRHPAPERRHAAEEFVALMTPVVKAFLTDIGFEATNLGMQVLGGHGYIREHGMEQYARDARIGQIYEGTNGVQALDLVGRKLPAGYLGRFTDPVLAFIDAHRDDAALAEFVGPLAEAFGHLQQSTMVIARAGFDDPEEAVSGATEYLRLFGLVALAYLWARMAKVALPKVADPFYRAKVDTARFYVQRLLPQAGALLAAISAGGQTITGFDESAF